MKFTRERFQNGSLRRVPRKTGPDVWEFRFRDHTKPGLPMRQMTLSTLEYPTETAARRALQEELLRINGSEAYIAQRSPTFGTVLDKFIQQKLMRHAQVSTTMKYGNAYMTEKRKAHGAVVQMVLPVRKKEKAEAMSASA